MGVKHTDEIIYFFGGALNASAPFKPEERLLSQTIMESVASFAKTGYDLV